jgi:hypothetical protein
MPTPSPDWSSGAPNEPLSTLLRSLCDGPPGPIRVRDMIDHFAHRAFGAVLFIFAVPNLLPLPPGSSTVLGLPLVIVAPQLALGVRSPWIPKALAERTVERETLSRTFNKLLPPLERLEKLLAPRLRFMFGPVGDRVIGLVCFILAVVLILPIPLGNMLPAAAISAFALALTQRDGLLALLGYLLTTVSCGVLVLSAGAVVAVFRHLLALLPL